jgi:hypothetical protein
LSVIYYAIIKYKITWNELNHGSVLDCDELNKTTVLVYNLLTLSLPSQLCHGSAFILRLQSHKLNQSILNTFMWQYVSKCVCRGPCATAPPWLQMNGTKHSFGCI